MGRKYVKERISENFVYPNNEVQEYGIEIVHDINDNSVSGTVSSFVAVFTGNSIQVSFQYSWALNGAEPFIDDEDRLQIYSVHMMGPESNYYKPYRTVYNFSTINTGLTATTSAAVFYISPEQYGVDNFADGNYYFEIRMIGRRAIFPICAEDRLSRRICEGCTEYNVARSVEYATPCTIEYQICDTLTIASLTIDPGDDYNICACSNTIYIPDGCDVTITDNGSCASVTPTPTATPTTTPTPTPSSTPGGVTPTPTPSPSCSYKTWVINECTLGVCSGGLCFCQGETAKTVYTDCTVTNITAAFTAIYENTGLTNPFTGDFSYGGSIWNSTGSDVVLVCNEGGPC